MSENPKIYSFTLTTLIAYKGLSTQVMFISQVRLFVCLGGSGGFLLVLVHHEALNQLSAIFK